MKRSKKMLLKPRNPLATAPLLAKGGAHQLRGKKATRARQKAALMKEGEKQ
jgi:hypothetical protein